MSRTNPAKAWACVALLAVTAAAHELRVVGSDLLGPGFTRALAASAREREVSLRLDLRGSRPGWTELQAGRADLGLFLVPPGEKTPADGVLSFVIGYAVTVVAVPAGSPRQQAAFEELKVAFGNSGDTGTHALDPAAGLAWPHFARQVLADASPHPAFAASAAQLAERLRANSSAIGVGGVSLAGQTGVRVLPLARDRRTPAVAPTGETVHRGDYPLRLALCVSFRRAAAPGLQPLLQFLLSDEAAAALAPADILPLPPGERDRLRFELENLR